MRQVTGFHENWIINNKKNKNNNHIEIKNCSLTISSDKRICFQHSLKKGNLLPRGNKWIYAV